MEYFLSSSVLEKAGHPSACFWILNVNTVVLRNPSSFLASPRDPAVVVWTGLHSAWPLCTLREEYEGTCDKHSYNSKLEKDK